MHRVKFRRSYDSLSAILLRVIFSDPPGANHVYLQHILFDNDLRGLFLFGKHVHRFERVHLPEVLVRGRIEPSTTLITLLLQLIFNRLFHPLSHLGILLSHFGE